MQRIICVCAMVMVCAAVSPARGQLALDQPHHHLHDFAINVGADGLHNTRAHRHALAMGYNAVPKYKPADPAYEKLGLIYLHNAHNAGVRITVSDFGQAGESISVNYQRHWGGDGREHTLFKVFADDRDLGQSRQVNQAVALGQADLDYIKRYGSAKTSAWSSLATPGDVTGQALIDTFHTSWYSSSPAPGATVSFNITANLASVDATADMIRASTVEFGRVVGWDSYTALFFDSVGGNHNLSTANAHQGPGGAYDRWSTGQRELIKSTTDYARNTAKTGLAEAYRVTANIWNPTNYSPRQTVLKWWADETIRLDHYYYEQGGFGTQAPNGVVPGTDRPAYVDDHDPAGKYLPASMVALDDVYGYNKKLSTYDADTHVRQHLDACGTAGVHGSWFGWYGEDYLNRKDAAGEYMYSNAMQLARAIPNWDNLAGVPVPAVGSSDPNAPRRFDADALRYESLNSYADPNVLYGRNPLNDELYAVFRDASAQVALRDGETISAAWWTDDLFQKTGDSAMGDLLLIDGAIRLAPGAAGHLGRGLRIEVVPEPTSALIVGAGGVLLSRRRLR